MTLETGRPTDEELIVECRAATPDRKRELVGELASRHHRGLVNFVYSFVSDLDVAEDLVQETFIRVYKKAETYQTIAKFSTWLYRIARNLALNEIRNRKRRPALLLNRPMNTESASELAAFIEGKEPDPTRVVEKADVAALVRSTIAEMPDPFREVLVLCDLQRMSYQECAEVLGIKIGTVRSRLSRARTQFERKIRRVVQRDSARQERV